MTLHLEQPDLDAALDTQRLRVWLRLLKLTRMVGSDVRERLRVEHDVTLPQFDVLAALWRAEAGLTMSALSQALMVSNGNVTGIIERLVDQALVVREPVARDRRATLVRLTDLGRETFAVLAAAHRTWVGEALGRVDARAAADLIAMLDAVMPDAGPRP